MSSSHAGRHSAGTQEQRILVVDADDDRRAALILMLAGSGEACQVEGVATPAEAVAALSGTGFDCVLADLRLGQSTGADPLGSLSGRATERTSALADTRPPEQAEQDDITRSGASDPNPNDFDAARWITALHHAIGRTRSKRAAQPPLWDCEELLEALPIPALVADRSRSVVYANGGWGAHARADLLGASLLELIDAPYRAACDRHLNEVFTSGTRQEFELRIAGSPFIIQLAPLQANAVAAQVLVAAIPVRGLRQAEEVLQRADEALEPMPDAVLWADASGAVREVNAAALKFYGYSRDEMTALHLGQLDPHWAPESWSAQRSALAKHGAIRFECVHRARDGTSLSVEFSELRVSHHGEDSYLALARPVAEPLRADREARLLAAAIDQAPVAMLIAGRDGSVLYANAALERLTGYSRCEVLGSAGCVQVALEEEPACLLPIGAVLVRNAAQRLRVLVAHQDGSRRPAELTVAPMRAADQAVVHWLGFLRDSSERDVPEERLRQAQKMEAMERLAGGIAHDINNVLTTIVNFTGFVRDSLPFDDNRQQDLSRVLQAAHSAAQITGQLLSFSRHKPIEPLVVDLNAAVIALGAVIGRLFSGRLSFALVPAHEELLVRMAPGQLDQVLFNLAFNARDAMPDGGTLSITVRHDADGAPQQPSGWAVIEVRDTGVGMTDAVAARAFDPFFTTKGERGTGLGLATCHGIVRQAGGAISLRSAPGSGSTITVRLPLATEAPTQRMNKVTDRLPLVRAGARVLVVEDQPAILEAILRGLRHAGLSAIAARSAEEALHLVEVQGAAPDLLISDIMLPQLNGIELLHRLRRLRPELAALLTSGFVESAATDLPLDEKTVFMQKPFTQARLLEGLGWSPETAELAETPTDAGATLGSNTVTRGLRVLLVEDHPAILEALARQLRRFCDVQTARCGDEAIKQLEADFAIGLVVSDLNMPRGSGLDLYGWLQEHRPSLASQMLLLSGGTVDDEPDDRLSAFAGRIFTKPNDVDRLISVVQTLSGEVGHLPSKVADSSGSMPSSPLEPA